MEKSPFNFKILKKDGNVIDLHEDKNIWVSSFRIPSPSPEHMTETVDGRHGSIYLGTSLRERIIPSSMMIEAADSVEFDFLKDELNQIFNPLEKFYIIRDIQPWKRLEVSVASEFNVNYLSLEDGEFDMDFVIHSSFIESAESTLSLLNADTIWQIDQSPEDLEYIHTTTSFRIYNDGHVPVNPREQPLLITFKGASNNLTIKNLTTGDVWNYTGTSNPSDTIELNGLRAVKNGLSIFRDTNHKLISLAPGLNDFELTGAIDPFEISFDFRFYYL